MSSDSFDLSNKYPMVHKWFHNYVQEKGKIPKPGFLATYANKKGARLVWKHITEYYKDIDKEQTAGSSSYGHKDKGKNENESKSGSKKESDNKGMLHFDNLLICLHLPFENAQIKYTIAQMNHRTSF